MESKHEEWVLETTNFLNTMQVRVYESGWNANSLEGMKLPKGEVMEIPARLMIFMKDIASERRSALSTSLKLSREESRHRETTTNLSLAEDLLVDVWEMLEGGDENLTAGITMEKLKNYLVDHMGMFEEEEDDR